MKKRMFMAVACLGFGIGFAKAQSMESVRVNLPVATRVGDVSLPAGHYLIRELNNSVIEISSQDRKGVNTFATVNEVVGKGAADHTKVVLKHDSNGYRIQTIWIEGEDIGYELTSAE